MEILGQKRGGLRPRTKVLKCEQSVRATNILVDRSPNNLTSHCLALLVLEPFTSIPVQLWPYPRTYPQEHFYLLKKIVCHSTLYALFFQFTPSYANPSTSSGTTSHSTLSPYSSDKISCSFPLQGKLRGPLLNPKPK